MKGFFHLPRLALRACPHQVASRRGARRGSFFSSRGHAWLLGALLAGTGIANGQDQQDGSVPEAPTNSASAPSAASTVESNAPVAISTTNDGVGEIAARALNDSERLASAASANPRTQSTRSSSRSAANRTDFSAFRIIADRNIFDPNRSPRRVGNTQRTRTRPRVTESFSLVGTMSYAKGSFAFFDGSGAQYRKALKTSDAIAGYTIHAIAPDHVTLAAGNQHLELHVGMQMRREEEGSWSLAGRAESASSAPPPAAAAAAATPPSSASAATADDDENEVLKRLRLKRQQELQ